MLSLSFSRQSVCMGDDAGNGEYTLSLPDDAALQVTELSGDILADYLGRTAVAMGAAGFALTKFISIGRIMCLVEIVICMAVYAVAVLSVRAVTADDLKSLPKGAKIAGFLEKKGLIK